VIARAGIARYLKKGVYVVQLHHPVLDRRGARSTTAITGMDIHDIARVCRTYGVKKYIIATPLVPQREMVKKIARHWVSGWGAEFNPDRREAMSLIKTCPSLDAALRLIAGREKAEPFTVATTARMMEGVTHWTGVKRALLGLDSPAAFIFGTGFGLCDEVLERSSVVMRPISGGVDGYNHLSVRSAVGIVLDRFFGFR
jgi:tRNA (guanine37-N1)-methyltransferase